MINEKSSHDFIKSVFEALSECCDDSYCFAAELFTSLITLYPDDFSNLTFIQFKDSLVSVATDFKNDYREENYYIYDDNEDNAIVFDTSDWTLWFADDDDLETIRKVEKEEPKEEECSCEHKEIEEAVNKLREILKKYGHDPNVGLCVFGFCD